MHCNWLNAADIHYSKIIYMPKTLGKHIIQNSLLYTDSFHNRKKQQQTNTPE